MDAFVPHDCNARAAGKSTVGGRWHRCGIRRGGGGCRGWGCDRRYGDGPGRDVAGAGGFAYAVAWSRWRKVFLAVLKAAAGKDARDAQKRREQKEGARG